MGLFSRVKKGAHERNGEYKRDDGCKTTLAVTLLQGNHQIRLDQHCKEITIRYRVSLSNVREKNKYTFVRIFINFDIYNLSFKLFTIKNKSSNRVLKHNKSMRYLDDS